MSNTSKGWGRKGSKFWMQMVACFPVLEKEFIRQIMKAEGAKADSMTLEWISPRVDENLEEYELKSRKLKERLGIPDGFWDTWKGTNLPFWANRQPQWDGIAYCKSSKTLYLIEAKAHLSETYTQIQINMDSKRSLDSFEVRRASLQRTRKSFEKNNPGIGREETWWGGKLADKVHPGEKFYYQLGNRLAFLKFMNEKVNEISPDVENVKLILLNFADDYTLDDNSKGISLAASIEEWEKHYEMVWSEMTGSPSAPDNVLVINYSVKDVPVTEFERRLR